uniref:Xanthine dehydrogenase/oxidase n=1 Tax=Tetraodon nigroviridis TaxID=99883 RepID=H3CM91_TETNG
SSPLIFFVNGKKVVEGKAEPEMSLLTYLRRKLGLTGTKLGYAEGGCGACTDMLSRYPPPTQQLLHYAVNACLAPVCSLLMVAVTTVEGIGSVAKKLHPVQERIAKAHGSQCGFCTPGIVMSMYALLRNNPTPKMADVEEAFHGNLCRCTGYRPILEGFKTLTVEGGCCGGRGRGNGCCMANGSGDERSLDGRSDEVTSLFNADDFAPVDPTQEVIFPPELMSLTKDRKPGSLCFRGERTVWLQPDTLDEFLQLKWEHPSARVVVGNTEVGIEVKFKNMVYPVLLAPDYVPELHVVTQTEDGVVFGAACTLSHMGAVLREKVETLPPHQTQVFLAVLEQLRWFAGLQIRNVAVGGNIMTASPISDLNPVFMAAGCKLTLMDKEGTRVVPPNGGFFTGYRRTVVKPQEVLVSIEIPYSKKTQFVSAFKQSPRREDDISTVTAAMSVTLPVVTPVEELKLSYGGMAATTVMAVKTANRLVGRSWGEELLQEACSSLAEEMTLDPSVPGGMVPYRRTLTLSLFYKFYLTVLQKLRRQGVNVEEVPSHCLSATEVYHPETPSSVQIYQAVPEGQRVEDMVGRPMMHLSALKQATGEAVYCDDVPLYENELYAALITSSKAHANILSVDTAAADQMPGVVGCVFVHDIPGSNATGPIRHDGTVLADRQVTCVGHIIGAVVADTQLHAQRAAKAVSIQYEELRPIITIQEAIAAQSFYSQLEPFKMGDLEAGFKQADHMLEGEIHIGGQEHFYLETHVTLAVPRGEDGEMEIFVSTQNACETQSLVAKVLGVPNNRVLVRVKRMGGGFGGKESRSTILSTVVAVAADKYRLKRPVRCMLDRDEDMLVSGGRHPFYAKYKVGFLSTGKVVALDVSYYSNAGNSLDLSLSIMERALFHMENSYNVANVRGRGFLCRTNLPSNTAFRGFGGPQGMMVAENWITDVAQSLGKAAEEVRRLNLYVKGDATPYNHILDGLSLDRCWDECLFRSKYGERRAAVDTYNRQNRWTKRGLAIVPTKFGIGFTAVFLNQAGALVHIYTDGSVLLTHGGTEMGQGLHTKMVQVASRVLDIPCSKIHISETSTNTVPNTSATAASASSDLNGAAVRNACEVLVKRLAPYKSQNPGGSWEDWVKAAYLDRVNLSANGFYKTPDLGYSFESNSGRAFNYFSYGVACSEVEIDCLTGAHKNLSTAIVMDVGHSINPAIDIGQVEGGFMQGLGLFTLEELHYSPQGVLLTRGPGSYKIPAFGDIPTNLTVSLLRDAPNDKAIFSSKAVGEPPLFLAASIFYAIKDAVAAARRESGLKGPFRLDSPASAERIRNACIDEFTQKCPPAAPGSFSPWSVRV